MGVKSDLEVPFCTEFQNRKTTPFTVWVSIITSTTRSPEPTFFTLEEHKASWSYQPKNKRMNMTHATNISAAQLRKAATIKDKIEMLQGQLSGILGESAPVAVAPIKRKRRKMSATARAKIGAAQRARWAKQKAGKK